MKTVLSRFLFASLAVVVIASDSSSRPHLPVHLKIISPETTSQILNTDNREKSIPDAIEEPATIEQAAAIATSVPPPQSSSPPSPPQPIRTKLYITIPTGMIQLPSRNNLILTGCILAANNGFMNGLAFGGILKSPSSKQAIAAVTTAWTTSALAAANRNTGILQTQISVIFSYMGGSFLNGFFNPRGIENALPLVMAALLVAAAHSLVTEPLPTWMLLALATGMTNSWTSQLVAGNLLRTAHFSGITSDMGTILGQMVRGNKANVEKFQVFALLAASFWVGGCLSVVAANEWGADALRISIAVYVVVFGRLVMG